VIQAARRVESLAFGLLFLTLSVAGQAPTPPPVAPSDPGYTINVKVNEVLLHATVRSRKGTPVAGLKRENFQIFEDRVMQQIRHFSQRDIPVTVGLVIDNSGSMRPRRAEVIAAALAFAASSHPQDQMFLVNFNENVWMGLPRGLSFTDDPGQLQKAMSTVISNGKTALYDAVIAGLQHLQKGTFDKKVLIVVSDGADNASIHTKEEMLALAARSQAIIYGLGIYEPDDPDNRHPRQALTAMATATGGEAFFPRELREVLPICERVAGEIRNQYTLSYVPTNHHQDGSYRTIQVRAETPQGRGLAVTTRRGYLAPKPVTPHDIPKL
jgi:Ca-activated chloride channel homolog